MNIVLLGIQGSGKGTLVLDLEKYFDFTLVSVGQLLRDEISTGSVLGKQIKEKIDKGLLVDLNTIKSIVENKLKNNTRSITIFDGFPRNREQAEMLDKIAKVDLLIYLKLTKDLAIDRVLNRLMCTKCGNITTAKATNSNICLECGGKLARRSDDRLEAVEKRFEQYEKETFPLLEKYRAQGVVLEIDASKTPEEVLDIVLKVIKNEHKN